MDNSLIPNGIAIVQQAIAADSEGDYEKALGYYRDALARFTMGLKYEKNEARKKLVLDRVEGYMKRAEELSDYLKKQNELDKGGAGGVAAKSKDDKDGDDSMDAEKKKLRGALAGAIVSEKPNVKWDDVAGLTNAKESLKEVRSGCADVVCFHSRIEVLVYYRNCTQPYIFVVSIFTSFFCRRCPDDRSIDRLYMSGPYRRFNPRRPSSFQPNSRNFLLANENRSKEFCCMVLQGTCCFRFEYAIQQVSIRFSLQKSYFYGIYDRTGKSYLAKAVATEADSTFFTVSSADLISKWQGESERLVRNLFEMAREGTDGDGSGRSIIFIDEVDSLCGSRSEGESDSMRRVKTEFLVQMDGVGKDEGKVLILGATNIPWELDAAIRRRFEKRVYIPLPEAEARTHMVKLHLGDTPNNLTEEDFEKLGQITEGASGSDIKVLVKEALMQPIRRCQQSKQFYVDDEGFYHPCSKYPNCSKCPPKLSSDPPGKDYTCKSCGAKRMTLWEVPPEKLKAPMVVREDFEKVMRNSVTTVSPEELARFTEWTKQFGQDGA